MNLFVFIFITFVLSAQTEVNILQYGSSTKMYQFELLLINETISEYNKLGKEQLKLKFPTMYSVKHIIQFLKKSNSNNSIAFNSMLNYGTYRNLLENSHSYISVKSFLFRLKTDIAVDNWTSSYLRVGFMINTYEEALFDSLQYLGSFSGVPLKNMEEKKQEKRPTRI